MGFFGAVFAATTLALQWHLAGALLALPFIVFAALGLLAAYPIRSPGIGFVPSDAGGGPSCGAASARALGTQFEDNIFYSFGGVPDGGQPMAGLFESDDGSYWGTTSQGGTTNSASGCGSGCGIVFQVALVHNFNHSFYKYTQIADFTGYSNADGSTPVTALAADGNGSLYGLTATGGTSGQGDDQGLGGGCGLSSIGAWDCDLYDSIRNVFPFEKTVSS